MPSSDYLSKKTMAMKKQVQLTTYTIFMVLAGLTGYGQNVGDEFPVDGIRYRITSLTEVEKI